MMKQIKFYLAPLLCCIGYVVAAPTEENTVDNGDNSFTYTQKISAQSTPPHYIAPSGYGFDVYSWFNQDYGWQHSFSEYSNSSIQILSATLLIRGFDIDSEPSHGQGGEYDGISVDGVDLNPGLLQGTDNTWSETSFSVPINSINDDGLINVFLDIDMNHNSRTWATTLDYSLLTIEYLVTPSEPPYQPELSANPPNCTLLTDNLTVSVVGPTPADPDLDAVTYTYRWYVDVGQGYYVDDEFAGKNDHTGNNVPFSQTDMGETWRVEVYPYDINGIVGPHSTYSFPNIGDCDGDGVGDDNDDYPSDPERAFTVRTPNNGFYALAFEDLWPQKGDYDLNDFVVNYSFTLVTNAENKVKDVKFNGNIRARGASKANGFAIAFDGTTASNVEQSSVSVNGQSSSVEPEAGHNSELVMILVSHINTVTPASAASSFYNTEASDTRAEIPLDMEVTFIQPINQSTLGTAPYNPFIFRTYQRGREIHLVNNPPTALADLNLMGTQDDDSNAAIGRYYLSNEHYPWALDITSDWKYPYEYTDITVAYPQLKDWAESNGFNFQTWHENPDTNHCWKCQ